jgi:nitrate reductase delta subunit
MHQCEGLGRELPCVASDSAQRSQRTTARPAAGSLRVLAALLAYPDAALRQHLAEMRDILRDEAALSTPRLVALQALIDHLAAAELLESEADYVELFDRGRGTSLHLFEHVHGDSRDRGPAMIDLAQTYEKAGLYLAPGELPDYLPAVLEFVSTQPPTEARAFLGEIIHPIHHGFKILSADHFATGWLALIALIFSVARFGREAF